MNYSNDTKTILKLSLFLECNELPRMDEINDAINRRLDITPFISKFVDQAEYEALDEETIKEKNIMVGNSYYKTDEFKNRYKQALIMILFKYFEEYKKNGFRFNSIPKECKELSKDYMAVSDDIYSWFSNFYEKEDGSEECKNVIFYDDLYNAFENSALYENMSKSDKRTFNLKSFTKKINNNMFLQPYIKERDTRYNKKKYNKAYIIGFKKIEKDDDDNDTITTYEEGVTTEEDTINS
jgi:phage/plasmid-associated DNA primase